MFFLFRLLTQTEDQLQYHLLNLHVQFSLMIGSIALEKPPEANVQLASVNFKMEINFRSPIKVTCGGNIAQE